MKLKAAFQTGLSLVLAMMLTGQTARAQNQPTPTTPQEPTLPVQNQPAQNLQTMPAPQPQAQPPAPAPVPARRPTAVHDINAPPAEPAPGTPVLPLEAPADNIYTQVNLVADIPTAAQRAEDGFINPMGFAFGPTVPIRIALNGTGVVASFGNDGQPFPSLRQQRINIPSADLQHSGKISSPTGVIFNETPEFIISSNRRRAPGRFIFVTEDGTIAGWSPDVDAHTATLAVDNSRTNVVYTGVAHGVATTGVYLYVANFRGGTVDVFDRSFHPTAVAGRFVDADIPPGYAPFGIQRIGEQIFVAYARQNPDFRNPVPGAGNGFINVFDYQGHRLRRLASQGPLNAPWGMTQAPLTGFGRFSGALLVGNHGDGRISAFNIENGECLGLLLAPDGNPIQIEGLWGLATRRIVDQPPAPTLEGKNVVFFTAGPGQQMHGLFGRIEPGITAPQTARR